MLLRVMYRAINLNVKISPKQIHSLQALKNNACGENSRSMRKRSYKADVACGQTYISGHMQDDRITNSHQNTVQALFAGDNKRWFGCFDNECEECERIISRGICTEADTNVNCRIGKSCAPGTVGEEAKRCIALSTTCATTKTKLE